jgi:hypothetical protein
LDEANRALDAAIAKATEQGTKMNIAVVDASGRLARSGAAAVASRRIKTARGPGQQRFRRVPLGGKKAITRTKIPWRAELTSVQPRIRLTCSFDQRSPRELIIDH